MSLWYVYKDREDRARQWFAIPVHAEWWEKPQGRSFPQWDMAQRYADRMARHPLPKPTWRFKEVAEELQALGFKQEEQA